MLAKYCFRELRDLSRDAIEKALNKALESLLFRDGGNSLKKNWLKISSFPLARAYSSRRSTVFR